MTNHPLTEPLDKRHVRKTFSCSEPTLDTYLRRYASQDQKRRVAAVFVLADEDGSIRGYYTLSSLSIPTEYLSEQLQRWLPNYPHQPATLLGRLAVDTKQQGKGLGEMLLMDALYRSYVSSQQVGSIAVVVDAINPRAAAFYAQYGFIAFVESERLFLPMQTIAQLF